MFYSLLGRTVWFGLKLYLGRKYGRTYVPKSLLAGATVAVGVAVGVAVLRARSDAS
jgi:membrane protein DedA with SNARE-associated domain